MEPRKGRHTAHRQRRPSSNRPSFRLFVPNPGYNISMQFRLRTLLIISAIVPFSLGWLGTNYRLVQKRQPYFSRFNDHDFPLRGVGLHPPVPSENVPWVRRMLGDCSAGTLLYDPSRDKDGLIYGRVQGLFPEAKIFVWPFDDAPLPTG